MRKHLSIGITVLGVDVLDFSRRAGRSEYAWGTIICNIYAYAIPALASLVSIRIWGQQTVPRLVDIITGNDSPAEGGILAMSIFIFLVSIHALVASIALTVRRFHDFGLPGILVLIAAAVLIYLNIVIDHYAQTLINASDEAWKLNPANQMISTLIWLVFGIPKGNSKPNRWGSRPASWPLEQASGASKSQPNPARKHPAADLPPDMNRH